MITMLPLHHCSHIVAYHARKHCFKKVMRKIRGARLPVRFQYKDSNMHFYYRSKCDGITAKHLERIILALIALYKGDE